jgi:hypothetical protein
MPTIEQQLKALEKQLVPLIKELKTQIGKDYRASDDPDDNLPGMCVTIGFTAATEDDDFSWSYQTGDNSYTGGAYSHSTWGVASLYRRSNSKDIARELCDDIANNLPN